MLKKRIITDDMDLSSKTAMTSDSFYDSKALKTSSDSANVSPIYKGSSRFFALLSTSDKAINSRLYDKESWKSTVKDGTWEGPLYAKPMIRNHDIREQTPFGRIKDSFFVEHGSFDTTNKNGNKLEEKVLDFYKGIGALEEGSGSVIVEFSSDEITANRMMAGLDVTVSQSSYFKDATCTVCGQDYFGGECSHIAGRTYSVKKDDVSVDLECLVATSTFEPIELSIVNTPANDTSVIYVLNNPVNDSRDDKEQTEAFNDSKEMPGIDDIENKCKDSVNNKTNETEDKDKMFKEMLKDTLKANIKKEISDSTEMLTAFETLFDAATEETLPLVKALMDEFAKVVETMKTENADDSEAVAEEVHEIEATEPEAEVITEETPAEVVAVEETPTEDNKEIEEKVKDALGVVKERKTSADNKLINTVIKGLKL